MPSFEDIGKERTIGHSERREFNDHSREMIESERGISRSDLISFDHYVSAHGGSVLIIHKDLQTQYGEEFMCSRGQMFAARWCCMFYEKSPSVEDEDQIGHPFT
ncbi:hypothetical protein TNCV_4049391 [Trichonephila clavipes]|nr:hypothetical protein TNCV_4049391 [Trichonephila clavipes]